MRFPIKGTVFAVFLLLINLIFAHIQPARAENTVTFKMVILPAEDKTDDVGSMLIQDLFFINKIQDDKILEGKNALDKYKDILLNPKYNLLSYSRLF